MNNLSRRGLMSGVAAAGAAVALAPATTAKAAAPAAGKQAPGYYRHKVGDFEVTVVTDGKVVIPLPETYVANAKKDAVNEVIAANYLPTNSATHLYTPVVINTGSKLVVIDTGLGLGTFAQSKGAAGQFHTNLAASGIDPKSVDAVVISHFHGDHINGLLDADNKLAFPNAEIMVPAAEWKQWMDDSNMSKAAGTPVEGNYKNSRRVFGAFGNKVTQYDDGKELVGGIKAIATPGHTPGHMSYLVTSGPRSMIVQSDITAGMAFLFVKNPDWQLAFDMDKALAVQSRKKIYDMAIAEKIPVQGFHFPFPGLAYVEKDGNGYRLIPATWNPTL
ncbi:MAG: MBL fold metallo-hydrolase [Pseudorhodoplanes sp.]|uniref:MBL fold metallo-hydrolase n=1 Tax=Pseudorhodoplanes sp. TaxID=1934341 RepID=UPI003D0BDD52